MPRRFTLVRFHCISLLDIILTYDSASHSIILTRVRHGRDHLIVGCTTTYPVSVLSPLTKVVSSNPVHGEVYSIQLSVLEIRLSNLLARKLQNYNIYIDSIEKIWQKSLVRINFHWPWATGPLLKSMTATLCDKGCLWLATGWWFSPGTSVSSNKIDCHNITETLLNVAFNRITLPYPYFDKQWIIIACLFHKFNMQNTEKLYFWENIVMEAQFLKICFIYVLLDE